MLREACWRPRIWPRISSLMARPAASSAARLIRRPVLRRSIDFDTWAEVLTSPSCAISASTLLLIRRDILSSFPFRGERLVWELVGVRGGCRRVLLFHGPPDLLPVH